MARGGPAALRADRLSWTGNVVLTGLKLSFGILSHSQALLADGVHNVADLGANLAVSIALRVAHMPADREHPYGHQKAESVAEKIVGILLILAGMEILYEAASGILRGHLAPPGWIAAAVAGFSLVLKQGLYVISRRAALEARSKALRAIAADHRADVAASLLALIGIVLARLWLPIFDPVMAMLVAGLVVYSGWKLVSEAVSDLMDRFDDQALLRALTDNAASVLGVGSVNGIRGRHMGEEVLIDLEISVAGEMTVRAGHGVATEVKRTLMQAHPEVVAIHVHVNPVEGEGSPNMENGED